MKMEQAKIEKEKHAGLINKVLIHKKYHARMKMVDMGVAETCSTGKDFYVYCKLKGKLGDVTETLDYVLKNYSVNTPAH